jgi:homocysteine S-methyltransferase
VIDFRTALRRQVVLFDGAMGTEIYRRGIFINRAFEELNLSSPELIRAIHESYVKAGAQVLTTNTYGAGRRRMKEFGLDESFDAINAAGVRIAREVAGEKAWVAASIGPLGRTIAPVGRIEPGQAFAAFKEQAAALAAAKPDLFVLETFADPRELWQAVRAVRSVSDLPIAACMAFSADANGNPPPDAAEILHQVAGWPIDLVGVNCGAGPRTLMEIVEAAAPLVTKPLLVMPNAGHPQEVDGRQIYLASPEYMAEYARRFVQKGARAVGGCCGTTPEMIKEIRTFVRSVSPGIEVVAPAAPPTEENVALEPTPVAERTSFAARLMAGKFCISVELDPPRGLDPSKSVEGAAFLQEHGIDVINIADGPRAVARMGPTPLAYLAKQRCGIESVVHYCCRDRNLLAMQMDLIGANALGLRNILAVTGDPPKMGSYPNATAVFDVDSIGLIAFIQMLNRGLDFAGRPLGKGEKTSLFVGAGCNPAHVDLPLEVARFGRKIEAGAEFFFSQPVYDEEMLFRFLEMTEQFPKVPFLVGILPLASYKNAEFLHNEVPGMAVPAPVLERLRRADSRDAQRAVGIEVARETLKAVRNHPRINGAYVYPPFGSYQRVLDVVDGIR